MICKDASDCFVVSFLFFPSFFFPSPFHFFFSLPPSAVRARKGEETLPGRGEGDVLGMTLGGAREIRDRGFRVSASRENDDGSTKKKKRKVV